MPDACPMRSLQVARIDTDAVVNDPTNPFRAWADGPYYRPGLEPLRTFWPDALPLSYGPVFAVWFLDQPHAHTHTRTRTHTHTHTYTHTALLGAIDLPPANKALTELPCAESAARPSHDDGTDGSGGAGPADDPNRDVRKMTWLVAVPGCVLADTMPWLAARCS
eukprot:SAG22_NODE_170_length_16713_cov_33.746298_3_plen_164_part_00